jgi:hypothetical protein
MTDGTSRKAILMTQKAEHQYQTDYQNAYAGSDGSKWIWGSLAALAALTLIIWLAYSGPSTGLVSSGSTTTEQVVPAPLAPVAPPAAGGTQNP